MIQQFVAEEIGVTSGNTALINSNNFESWMQTFSDLPWEGAALLFRDASTPYRFAREMLIHRCLVLAGVVSGRGRSPAILYFSEGSPGIRINGNNGLGSGEHSIIRNIRVEGRNFNDENIHGIKLDQRAHIEHCHIQGFGGDGIHLNANIGGNTNANQSSVMHTTAMYNRNGLYAHGPDSNVLSAICLDASSNRQWGIFDDSFLGNNFLNCHSATNEVGAWRATGAGGNQPSVFEGGYTENDQPPSVIDAPSMTIGGSHFAGMTGDGLWLDRDFFKGRGLQFGSGPSDRTIIGSGPTSRVFQQLKAFTGTQDFHTYEESFSYWDPINMRWCFGASAHPSNPAFSITSGKSIHSDYGVHIQSGRLHVNREMWLGPIRMTPVVSLPTEADFPRVTFSQGDRLINRMVVSGQPSEWACKTAGTMGPLTEGLMCTTNGSDILTLNKISTQLLKGMVLLLNLPNGLAQRRILSITGVFVQVAGNMASTSDPIVVQVSPPTFTVVNRFE